MNDANRVLEEPMLRHFRYAHLPADLGAVSVQFATVAHNLVRDLARGVERTVALRKLLEAKDAAVRQAVDDRALAQPVKHDELAGPTPAQTEHARAVRAMIDEPQGSSR